MIKQVQYKLPGVLAVALLLLVGTKCTAAGSYSIDYLITPYHPEVVDSWLFGINNQGESTGYTVIHPSGGPFTRAAIAYKDGNSEVVATGTSGDPFGLVGFAINNHGDIIGNVDDVPTYIAAGGASTPIEVPDLFVSLFVAGLLHGGLNDTGNALVAAFPFEPSPAPTGALSGLALWNPGGSTLLSPLDSLYPFVNPPDINDFNSGPSSGVYTASVTGLNNANQFAAGLRKIDFDPVDPENFEDDIFSDSFTQAYLYDGQGGHALLAAMTPGDEIRPIDIDETGTVFGWTGTHLALWGANGALQSVLPDPATTLDDVGYNGYPTVQRNNLGQVVGVTVDGGVLFYDPLANSWTDVTTLIAGLETGTFSTIQDFNDLGQFVGLARPPQGGGVYGYVVSLVPEPSSLLICGIGLVFATCTRCRKISATPRVIVRPCLFAADVIKLVKPLTIGLAALALFFGGIKESQGGPIDVSYTLSGTPGNYDLNFSVTNNMLAWPTQNVYFFAVRLSVDNIVGSPAPFFNNAPADANWFNYGGSATDYNNTWFASGPPFAPAFLLPGVTHSGFIVHIPDQMAPTAVSWSALSVSAGEIHPYTGGGNFINQANPGFEGLATPAIVPEPPSLLLSVLAVVGVMILRGHRDSNE